MNTFEKILALLKVSLNSGGKSEEEIQQELAVFTGEIGHKEWSEIAHTSKRISVGCLMYDVIKLIPEVPDGAKKEIEKYSRSIAQNNYKLLTIEIWLDKVLSEAGIKYSIMKGMSAAVDFPVPELRKSRDIDILLMNPGDIDRAVKEVEKLGFKKEKNQGAIHHVEMSDKTGLEIEVHTMMAIPFDNYTVNSRMEALIRSNSEKIIRKDIMGAELPVLPDAMHAFELLLHMLQHFLRAGFGIKLLCDWVTLWNRGLSEEDREEYMNLIEECGVKGFSNMITRVCIKYLGLERKNVLWMKPFDEDKTREEIEADTAAFMEELKDAGEFGDSRTRMVALRGSGFTDYVREFHHQMHLNFPSLGKVFIFWPVLWVITLVKFLVNNRKVRSVSAKELFENAGKRADLVKRMKIFEK